MQCFIKAVPTDVLSIWKLRKSVRQHPSMGWSGDIARWLRTQVVATCNDCSVNCMWMQCYSVGEILSVHLSWISSLVGLVTVALIFLDLLTCCHRPWLSSWEGRHVTKWDWGSAEEQWSWPRTVRTAKHSCFNEKVHCVRLKTLVNQVHFYM